MRFYISMGSQLLIAMVIGMLAVAATLVLALLISRLFTETRQKTVRRASDIACRNCGSSAVRPSYSSGFLDVVFSVFSLAPYRCEVCYWRFYVPERLIRKSQSFSDSPIVQTQTKQDQ